MRRRRDNARYPFVLIPAVAVMLICATSLPISSGLAFAQTAVASWSFTGSLNTARAGHTATLLLNGKVLVAGGFREEQRVELFDPASGTWSDTASLNTIRPGHTATLLQSGKVLVAGGHTVNGGFIETAELYDPATGTWSFTGSLNKNRVGHTATLLQNGKVLVAGGYNSEDYVTNSAELYDPNTGEWSLTGTLVADDLFGRGRGGHTATLLLNGKVLVAGGLDPGDFGIFTTELYDPTTGTWGVSGRMNDERGGHTATLLPNGHVLIAGACNSGVFCRSDSSSAEVYNPATGTWSVTGELNTPRFFHTATLLPNGRVLIAGGEHVNFISGTEVFLNSAEIYDPASGNWSTTASLNGPRLFHAATLLVNGKVLVVGGVANFSSASQLQTAELYDSGASSTVNPIDHPQFFVRQHYLDFLNREPEQSGLEDWLRVLNDCPSGDDECRHEARLTTSAAFFGSPEFQLKGYFVFRFYKLAFNRLPEYTEIAVDMQSVSGQTPDEVHSRKATFAVAFVRRPEFTGLYAGLPNADYVAMLLNRYGLNSIATPDPTQPDGNLKVTLTQTQLVSGLDGGTLTREQVLRAIADSDQILQTEFNPAFVAMQYYGYLRRTPELPGYNSWLAYLNNHPEDFREMVRGFVDSIEYRTRFGPP